MGQSVYNLTALGDITDLTIPTTTPKYKLGKIITLIDSESANPEVAKQFIYLKHISTINIHRPIVIGYTIATDGEVIAKSPTTEPSPIEIVAISQVTILSSFYGFSQIKGNALVNVSAPLIAISIGDPLNLANGGTRLVNTGTDKDTVALALASVSMGGTATDFPILMLGNKVAIAN